MHQLHIYQIKASLLSQRQSFTCKFIIFARPPEFLKFQWGRFLQGHSDWSPLIANQGIQSPSSFARYGSKTWSLKKDLVQLIIPHQNFKRSGGPASVINDTYRIATSGRKKKNNRIGEKFPKQLLTTGFAIVFLNFAVCRQGFINQENCLYIRFCCYRRYTMCFYDQENQSKINWFYNKLWFYKLFKFKVYKTEKSQYSRKLCNEFMKLFTHIFLLGVSQFLISQMLPFQG